MFVQRRAVRVNVGSCLGSGLGCGCVVLCAVVSAVAGACSLVQSRTVRIDGRCTALRLAGPGSLCRVFTVIGRAMREMRLIGVVVFDYLGKVFRRFQLCWLRSLLF